VAPYTIRDRISAKTKLLSGNNMQMPTVRIH